MRAKKPPLAAEWRRTAATGLMTTLALAGLLLAACQAQVPPVASTPLVASAAASDNAQAVALLSRIHAEIGIPRCDTTEQCRTVAIGEQACGGPQAWLAWSTQVSDATRLAALSAESAALARQRNAQSGTVSTCRYHADPGAQCVVGMCRLRSPDLAN